MCRYLIAAGAIMRMRENMRMREKQKLFYSTIKNVTGRWSW